MLRLIANIVWLIFGGLFASIIWFIGGLILYVTIIGIPFGLQAFKVARLMLAPFGKSVDLNFSKHIIANTLWAIFFGWEIFLANIISGIALCITIIGIPFGLQSFKFATLGFAPFGATIYN